MKTAIITILAVQFLPFAAVKLGPWIFASICFVVAASYFITRWIRVIGAVNASIARNIRP
jgi:hypothetical protein